MRARANFVVLGEASSLVLQVLLALHAARDAHCIALCRPGARVLRYSALCAGYAELDFSGPDDAGFAHLLNGLAATLPGLVLVPADCGAARLLGRLRPQLHAPSIPAPDAAMLARLEDKWSFFQFCAARGLQVPATQRFPTKAALPFAETARALGLPFVVKPVNSCSAKGVQLVTSEEDYRRKILDEPRYQHAPLVAQRYVRGQDVGVNLLARGGQVRALSIQRRLYQQRKGDGSEIQFFEHPALEAAALALAAHSRYDGVMNLDARIEEETGEVFLLECNPRFWRSLLASAWCGLNFVAECLRPPGEGPPRRLVSGIADIYYHPLFRPALLRYAALDRSERGRLVRRMLVDPCTFADSARARLRCLRGRDPLALASAPVALPPPASSPPPPRGALGLVPREPAASNCR
ncbi:ATP-grasp domain-containing protein [Aggregicoccus sp. 17bor-14]|uniref:ATP-grasp domain-containing protein n=1 Tax=Myxococcaceae TaxID=31 RepID=UPI00129CD9BC|nr:MULTISPECIES: ATP-grasp domain-containing protein [Myxococcaceae]MBF5043469.1 ATP-grasp domain-containing protein [Simulacricoccus sp. 17bor-14]MRI89227.1 ATP-grasp domain-containing protein [Aggregicoccus sp. 17bor-14]